MKWFSVIHLVIWSVLYCFLLFIGCSYHSPTYSPGECYSDGLENGRRIIRINSQYKTAWYYQLYVDGKDVGEYNMYTEETESEFSFKKDCPK